MSEQLAERFVEALGRLEAAREVEPLAALFAEECEVGNVVSPEKFEGREGARQFWTKYRDTFGEVRSTFRNRVVSETRAALEWTTVGYSAGGAPVAYEGVSILEFDGDRITRFRAYFNTEDLSRQILDHPGRRDAADGKAQGA